MSKPAVEMDVMTNCARDLGAARSNLAAMVAKAEAEVVDVRGRWHGELAAAADKVQALEQELGDFVVQCPELFVRPQSVEVDGVRFGIRKGRGSLELGDVDKLIARIRKHLTRHQKTAVLQVKTKVVKAALAKLPAELLKKLGVDVKGAGNEAFVSYPPSDTEKLLAWWIGGTSAASSDD